MRGIGTGMLSRALDEYPVAIIPLLTAEFFMTGNSHMSVLWCRVVAIVIYLAMLSVFLVFAQNRDYCVDTINASCHIIP